MVEMKKLLDKYLLFVILAFFVSSMFFTDNYFWFYLIIWIGLILYAIEKRKSIRDFIITKKIKTLDKFIMFLFYVLFVLFIAKDMFIKDMDKRLYWTCSILGISIILAIIISKRNLMQIVNYRDYSDNNIDRVKALNRSSLYILVGSLSFLSLAVFYMNMETFKYLSFIIIIIMALFIIINEYKKKSIKKE